MAGYPHFRASDFEFRLPRPSYTIHTLDKLAEQYPDREFHLIIGADNWQAFDRWKSPEEIIRRHHMLVYPRQGYPLEDVTSLPPHVRVVQTPLIEISSTFIRKGIREGKDLRYFLHPEVFRIIQEKEIVPVIISFLCSTTSTTSLGVNKRTSLREVPSPLVTITGMPALLYFSPVRKRLPYLEKCAGVHRRNKLTCPRAYVRPVPNRCAPHSHPPHNRVYAPTSARNLLLQCQGR
mgnify:CR=1 FL=1